MTFESEEANIGNAMNTTNGIFKTPVSGVYSFSCFGQAHTHYRTQVTLVKNGEDITSGSANSGDHFSLSSILQLQMGDLITVRKNQNHMFPQQANFTGILLREIPTHNYELPWH